MFSSKFARDRIGLFDSSSILTRSMKTIDGSWELDSVGTTQAARLPKSMPPHAAIGDMWNVTSGTDLSDSTSTTTPDDYTAVVVGEEPLYASDFSTRAGAPPAMQMTNVRLHSDKMMVPPATSDSLLFAAAVPQPLC